MDFVRVYIDQLTTMMKRAMEGRMGPVNFLIILGFFSSLILLYISLHVQLDGISTRIEEGTRLRQALEDEKLFLMSRRNELASAERIIPLAEAAGMQPGEPDRIHRIAFYRTNDSGVKEETRWALGGGAGRTDFTGMGVPESR